MRARLIGICLTFLCVLAAAGGASTASADQFTWLGPTALENTGGGRALTSVSCPSSAQCTALDASGQQVTFNPASGAISSDTAVDLVGTAVSSISCPSTTQCTAVDNKGNEVTFDPVSGAVSAPGVQAVDSPNDLSSVSCASGTQCVAVDGVGNEITFNPSSGSGTAHSVDVSNALKSVSCPSQTSQCTAVDGTGNEMTFTPGSGSSLSGGAKPIDGTNALSSVSCPAGDAAQCTAVDGKGNEVTFVPTTGAATSGPLSVDGSNVLDSVSCPTATQCTAVDAVGNEVTFSSAGAVMSGPQSVDGTTYLPAVSCPAGASNQCTAVDNKGNEVTFDPSSGTANAAGVRSIDAQTLTAVSCPLRNQCTALDRGPHEITFDPTSGKIDSPGLATIDSTGDPLASLSCPSSTQCTAVDHGPYETTFDPTTGTFNPPVIPQDPNALTAVSCPATNQCTTVDAAGNEVTFDPTTSTVNNQGLNSLYPVGTTAMPLQSVSCSSANQCTAVDSGGNEITFNPNSTSPNGVDNGAGVVPVDPGTSLDSVSCPAGTQCTAVDAVGKEVTFDPTTGTPTRSPASIDRAIALDSVSCPSSGQCTAVDSQGNEVTFNPSSPAAATPVALAGANSLQSVSCNSISVCAMVDAGGNSFAGFVPPQSMAAPTITGTAQQGHTLTEHQGQWANFATSYSYQWEDCDSSGAGCSAISGATSQTYTLSASDVGHAIRVQETATNQGGPGQPATSAPTSAVLPPPPSNTGPPTIFGTAQQGQTLTEQHGSWTNGPTSYSYQWEDCNSSGAGCSPISGATGQTYQLTSSDIGKSIVVQETAKNSGGSSAPASSPPTAPVAPAAAANISATTEPAKNLRTSSAVVHGLIYTQGVAASWQFQYGQGTRYNQGTPIQTIAAGNHSEIPVSWKLVNLRPNTTYHFRVVEVVGASAYQTPVTSDGKSLTFTTKPTGKLLLHFSSLSVSGRFATVPLKCQSQLPCVGRFSITTRAKISKHGHHRSGTALCDTTFTRIKPGKTKLVKARVYAACLTLLGHARNHRIRVQFTSRPRTGQLGIIKTVWLTL